MPNDITGARDIIAQWPTPADFAAEIWPEDGGDADTHARHMKAVYQWQCRDRLPAWAEMPVVFAARRRGIPIITPEFLYGLRP